MAAMAIKTKTILFEMTIPADGVVVFDCNNAEVLLNGQNASYAVNGNDFFNLTPKTQKINITPYVTGGANITGTLKYKEGWF